MGVVKRQGIKQSIVTYIGVLIGMVNVLIIYPACLKEHELGIITFVRETAVMLSVFAFLGSDGLIIRFFPQFKSKDGNHHGFLFFLFCILGFGCLLMMGGWLLFKDRILAEYVLKPNAELYLEFIPFILPFAVFISLSTLLAAYTANFQRIVFPAIFNEFYYKIGIAILVLSYFNGWITLEDIFWGSFGIYILIFISLLLYLCWLGEFKLKPDTSLLKKPLLKEMGEYQAFGFAGTFGGAFTSEFLSVFLVGTLTNLTSTGIFAIANFISNFIDIPRRAIAGIAAPLIAEHWNKKDLSSIADMYRKSALNQQIAGWWMLLAVWISVDEIFRIMPNGELYQSGKYVLLILGFSRLINMSTGLNNEIIAYSHHYRFNLIFALLTAVVHTLGNYFLIKKYQIIGAAIASLITQSLINLLRFLLLKAKTGLQPFGWANLVVILVGGVAYGLTILIPRTGLALGDAFIRSGTLTLLFASIILLFKVSPDINQLAVAGWSRLRKLLGL